MSRPSWAAKDVSNREKEVKLFVPNLEEVLRIELDGRVTREVKNSLNKASVLSQDLESESPALEVVEDAGVVAGDVHPAAEGGEVNIHRRFLGVTAEDYGVCLHVILEILSLKLREPRFHIAAAAAPHLQNYPHKTSTERSEGGRGVYIQAVASGTWRRWQISDRENGQIRILQSLKSEYPVAGEA